jgi:hypothetical protein
MEPDILYVVRPNERNETLKMSLRSLAFLPHRRVFIAGYCPEWVRNVTYIEVRRRANKFDAIEENMRQGLLHPELQESTIYFNDDFYITHPIEEVPVTHGGPASGYKGQQELKIRMRRTAAVLQGMEPDREVLTYDGVHMPLPLAVSEANRTLAVSPRGGLWRTFYGNVADIGGEQVPDAKARGPINGDLPTFLSTSHRGFHALRERLNDLIPERSCYVW